MSEAQVPKQAAKAKAKAAAAKAAAKAAEAVEEFDSDEEDITFEEQLALEKEEQARLANIRTKVSSTGEFRFAESTSACSVLAAGG